MTMLSISIPDDLRVAAEQAVSIGRFATVSEYIATLIRQDQELGNDNATEARLLSRVQGAPSSDMTDAHFDGIRKRLDAEIAKRRVP